MTTGKNATIFYNSISSEHFPRFYSARVFFLSRAQMYVVILKTSNSFDTAQCIKIRRNMPQKTASNVYNLYFSSLVFTTAEDSSTIVFFDVTHFKPRIAYGAREKKKTKLCDRNCFFAKHRCMPALHNIVVCDNSIAFSKQSQFIDIYAALHGQKANESEEGTETHSHDEREWKRKFFGFQNKVTNKQHKNISQWSMRAITTRTAKAIQSAVMIFSPFEREHPCKTSLIYFEVSSGKCVDVP